MARRGHYHPRGLSESQSFSFFGSTAHAEAPRRGAAKRSSFMSPRKRRPSDDGRLPALTDERYVGGNALVLLQVPHAESASRDYAELMKLGAGSQTLTGGYRSEWVGAGPGAANLGAVDGERRRVKEKGDILLALHLAVRAAPARARAVRCGAPC
jgi:hypothetical protein